MSSRGIGNVLTIIIVPIYFWIPPIFNYVISVTAQTGNGLAGQAITVKTSYWDNGTTPALLLTTKHSGNYYQLLTYFYTFLQCLWNAQRSKQWCEPKCHASRAVATLFRDDPVYKEMAYDWAQSCQSFHHNIQWYIFRSIMSWWTTPVVQ